MESSYRDACRRMMVHPSENSQLELSKRARAFFGKESNGTNSTEPFYIPPGKQSYQQHWLNGLARYLGSLPYPARLYLRPVFLDRTMHGTVLGSLQFEVDTAKIAIGISLQDQDWPPSLTLGHELFHLRQLQGQLAKSPDAWPRHQVSLPSAGNYPLKVDSYTKRDRGFFIEEIGAYLRDSIFLGRKENLTEAEAQEGIKNMLAAREFAEAGDYVYQIVWSLWSSYPTERWKMYSQTARGIEIFAKRGHKIDLYQATHEKSKVTEEWITQELLRGQLWIGSYSEVLRVATSKFLLQ